MPHPSIFKNCGTHFSFQLSKMRLYAKMREKSIVKKYACQSKIRNTYVIHLANYGCRPTPFSYKSNPAYPYTAHSLE